MTEICVEGETLVLDHRRALYWPSRSALVIADSHFGKSAIFRREGIALPEGSDQDDLVILGSLIDEYSPAHLCILGDFVHGALPAGHPFYSRFNHWRAAHPGVELHIVPGNHDVHLERQAILDVRWHNSLEMPPFTMIHEPASVPGSYYLAGHIHPVTRLSTRGDSLRVPVFWQRADGMVLPAFGGLTGGYAVRATRSERLHLVGPEAVRTLQ